jgi:hypothetical protein
MAAHNFDYSYEYVGVKTMPLNVDDDTQIVRNITVKVTAVDQDDSSQSLSEEQHVALDGVYSYKHDGLPDTFIPIEDLTDSKVIEWFKAKVQTNDLDNYFTWQIYGIEETPSE